MDKLFTENFNNIPFIGQICQFYPLLNISAVPILLITLRNNFMQVVPVKRWIRQAGCCKFLLDVSIILTATNSYLKIFAEIITNCCLIIVPVIGSQEKREGHLGHYFLTARRCHRHVCKRPLIHHHLHWRYLRAIHLVLNPYYVGQIWPTKARRPQQAKL